MIFNCYSKNSTYIIIVFTVSLPNQGVSLVYLNDVSPQCAVRHTSFAQRTSLGEAVIICRRQTSFKKGTFVWVDKSSFLLYCVSDLDAHRFCRG